MATALLLASGKGSRLDENCPKQFLLLGGEMLFMHSLRTFYFHSQVSKVFLVCENEYKGRIKKALQKANIENVTLVTGGKTRQQSSHLGLCAIKESGAKGSEIVLIHDCARPFVTSQIITNNIKSAELNGACTTAVKAVDSFILSENGNTIAHTLTRDKLYALQTPQTFRLSLILNAKSDESATDDTSLLTKQGIDVSIVLGNGRNFKITDKTDMLFAESLLQATSY